MLDNQTYYYPLFITEKGQIVTCRNSEYGTELLAWGPRNKPWKPSQRVTATYPRKPRSAQCRQKSPILLSLLLFRQEGLHILKWFEILISAIMPVPTNFSVIGPNALRIWGHGRNKVTSISPYLVWSDNGALMASLTSINYLMTMVGRASDVPFSRLLQVLFYQLLFILIRLPHLRFASSVSFRHLRRGCCPFQGTPARIAKRALIPGWKQFIQQFKRTAKGRALLRSLFRHKRIQGPKGQVMVVVQKAAHPLWKRPLPPITLFSCLNDIEENP